MVLYLISRVANSQVVLPCAKFNFSFRTMWEKEKVSKRKSTFFIFHQPDFRIFFPTMCKTDSSQDCVFNTLLIKDSESSFII